MDKPLSVYSDVDGSLDCLQFGAIIIKAAVNNYARVFALNVRSNFSWVNT